MALFSLPLTRTTRSSGMLGSLISKYVSKPFSVDSALLSTIEDDHSEDFNTVAEVLKGLGVESSTSEERKFGKLSSFVL